MSTGALGGTLRHLRDLFGDGTAVGLGDGQLLARFAHSGDQAAFEALVARHGPMVLATCRAVLKHEHDVEDAFQATFLVLARKARSVRAGDTLGGWLHRVAYRAAVQASGARRRRRRHEAEASAMAGRQAHAHPTGPDPDLPAIVHEELDRLADRHRLPVVLCDLEGLTYEQAAGQLHWTEPTLRHRLVRGRQQLRERLIRRGVTAGIGIGVGMSLDTASAASLLGLAWARASVPAALARSAVVAATGGSASIGADAIASVLLGGFAATTRLKIAAVILAGVAATAMISTGIVALGPGRAHEHRAGDLAKAPAVPPPASRSDDPKGRPAPTSPTGSIEGRILDLEGRPVAGARIRAVRIWSMREGDLGQWLEETRRRGRYPGQGMTSKESTLAAATGTDGRFRLDGVGPDQLVELEVSGPAIATSHLYVAGRDGADLRVPVETFRRTEQIVYHSRRFEHVVEPSKPVEGVVTDVDTGRPLARVGLRAAVFDSSSLIPAKGVAAVTDASGHYRIEGLPPAPAYRIFAQPGPGMPYPRATLKTSGSSRAFEPLRFDFALKRGILVHGRVTDRKTGWQPVSGFVDVYAFTDNPHLKDYPGYRMSGRLNTQVSRDGRFEVVALPGRGLIGFRADEVDRYRGYLGAEDIQGFNRKSLLFNTQPQVCGVTNYHVLAELQLDPKGSTAEVNLQVDPGRTIAVRPIDPEGQPVLGTSATGVGDLFATLPQDQPAPTIAIHALHPSHPRRVTVTHHGRKLIGSVYLKGDEAGPITLRLQPWGTITGRVVDDEGEPRPNVGIMSAGDPDPERLERQAVLPGGDIGGGIRLGPDGRFRLEGLVPGLEYSGDAVVQGVMLTGRLFREIVVKPGEARDLGDLKVLPYKAE